MRRKCARAGFYVEDQGVETRGQFLAQNGAADESGAFDGAGEVAQGVENAVGGDQRGGLADDGCAAAGEDGLKFVEGKGGAEAGDGFQFIESSAGVAESAAADHGNGEAAGGGDGSNKETGFVADAAGGVLIDGDFAQAGGREFLAGVAHGESERAGFVQREAAQKGGHQPGGELFWGDGAGSCAVDEEGDFAGVERAAVAFFAD